VLRLGAERFQGRRIFNREGESNPWFAGEEVKSEETLIQNAGSLRKTHMVTVTVWVSLLTLHSPGLDPPVPSVLF
jgi:hypothetical protein